MEGEGEAPAEPWLEEYSPRDGSAGDSPSLRITISPRRYVRYNVYSVAARCAKYHASRLGWTAGPAGSGFGPAIRIVGSAASGLSTVTVPSPATPTTRPLVGKTKKPRSTGPKENSRNSPNRPPSTVIQTT